MLHNSGQRENSPTSRPISHRRNPAAPGNRNSIQKLHPILICSQRLLSRQISGLGFPPWSLPMRGRCHLHTAASHSGDLGHCQQLQPVTQGLPVQGPWHPRHLCANPKGRERVHLCPPLKSGASFCVPQ